MSDTPVETEVEDELNPTSRPESEPEAGQSHTPLSRWSARRHALAQAVADGAPAITGSVVPELALPSPGGQASAIPALSIQSTWSVGHLLGLLARRRVALAVGALLLCSALAHGIDLLHYPYIQQDEGTYFADAWAIFHLGRLAPYTYFYDHAPLGWIQIAIWQLITFGKSFGYGVASGRVLMLLFQLGSALLVVGIGRRATGRWWVGLVAAALMSLEPYSIQYQRQILLDNIAVFWLLLSVYAVAGPITLRRIWLGAASLAIAILSKEVAIAAYPVLAAFVWLRSPKEIRLLGISSWLAISLSLCSVYAVMALLKGEFFPAGTLLGGSHPHVSLLCSIEWQGARGGGSLVNFHSAFWQRMPTWFREAPLPVAGGTAAAVGLVTVGRRLGAVTMIGWITLVTWLFLDRAGVDSSYYMLPALPFLALSITMAAEALRRPLERLSRRWAYVGAGVLATFVVGSTAVAYADSGVRFWTGDQVSGQLAAERWIDTHLPRDAKLLIDMSMWQDLHHPPSGRPFNRAEYYWKAAEDPVIRDGVFHDTWRDVDYVVTTPEMVQDTFINGFPVVERALQHSQLVRSFTNEGWAIQIRRVLPRSQRILFPAPQYAKSVAESTSSPNGCMGYGSK